MNQAKEEEYFIPSEEANEVERLLVEPQNDQVSVDGILCSRNDKLEQDIEMKRVTYSFGWPASNATEQGEDISKLNVLDAMPLQVEGGEHLPTTCENYFLESVTNLDHNPSERLNFGNSCSENLIMEFIHHDNLHIDKAICEINGNLGQKYDTETSIEANWLNYPNSESQNVEKLDENEMIFSPDLITKNSNQRQKRLRKPTRRYTDESFDLNSRFCRKRPRDSISPSKDRFMGVKFRQNHHHHHHHRHVGTREVALSDESFCKAIQVPFSPQGRKESQKKHFSAVVQTYYDELSSPSKSEEESVIEVRRSGGSRKHHKLWTLMEVRKLIDGVSQNGVGKWTQIKKLLFSSSPHRTPVDLKDKWRNLLKASSAQKQTKGEQKRNQPWRPLPKSMLRRVSELANIYPYPRSSAGRKFNLE